MINSNSSIVISKSQLSAIGGLLLVIILSSQFVPAYAVTTTTRVTMTCLLAQNEIMIAYLSTPYGTLPQMLLSCSSTSTVYYPIPTGTATTIPVIVVMYEPSLASNGKIDQFEPLHIVGISSANLTISTTHCSSVAVGFNGRAGTIAVGNNCVSVF